MTFLSKSVKRAEYATVVRNKHVPSTAGNTAQFELISNSSKNYILELICIKIQLTTSADVGNRFLTMVVFDEDGYEVDRAVDDAIVASEVQHVIFKETCGSKYTTISNRVYPLPKAFLDSFEEIQLVCTGGFAADAYSVNMQYRLIKKMVSQ